MLSWSDQGILLSKRTHGETGGIISLLTENHGRHHGYIYGAHSTRHKGLLDIGAVVNIDWSAKTNDQLGHFDIQDGENMALEFINDPLKLSALMSVTSLIENGLPEREEHVGLFWGTHALLEQMTHDHIWGAAIVMWEISFMKELGFALDFSKCAGGGVAKDLIYMSPKSGCTVSREEGEAYKDKLLPLPNFLINRASVTDISLSDVLIGIQMTGYFLEHWVFAQHSKGIPETRLRFARLLAQSVDHNKGT
jgi:DNA repair protein RecO (recombination protein O)